jgi:hypothetical protein
MWELAFEGSPINLQTFAALDHHHYIIILNNDSSSSNNFHGHLVESLKLLLVVPTEHSKSDGGFKELYGIYL